MESIDDPPHPLREERLSTRGESGVDALAVVERFRLLEEVVGRVVLEGGRGEGQVETDQGGGEGVGGGETDALVVEEHLGGNEVVQVGGFGTGEEGIGRCEGVVQVRGEGGRGSGRNEGRSEVVE